MANLFMPKRERDPYVYVFHEFPKLLYRLEADGVRCREVADEADQAVAEAEGWTVSPDGVVAKKGKK